MMPLWARVSHRDSGPPRQVAFKKAVAPVFAPMGYALQAAQVPRRRGKNPVFHPETPLPRTASLYCLSPSEMIPSTFLSSFCFAVMPPPDC